MRCAYEPSVTAAELHAGGVAVTFDNQTSANFPANLLYAARHLAEIMSEDSPEVPQPSLFPHSTDVTDAKAQDF